MSISNIYKMILTQFNNYNFRLAKFSSFSASSKLVSMLVQEEDKLKQSKAQGVAPSVDMNLAQLSHKYSTSGRITLNVKSNMFLFLCMIRSNENL